MSWIFLRNLHVAILFNTKTEWQYICVYSPPELQARPSVSFRAGFECFHVTSIVFACQFSVVIRFTNTSHPATDGYGCVSVHLG